jgi:hypothetical protein
MPEWAVTDFKRIGRAGRLPPPPARGVLGRPVIAEAVRRHFGGVLRTEVAASTPRLREAFRAQRAALVPSLSRILDARRTPSPTGREAAIRARLPLLPLAQAMAPMYSSAASAGHGFASTLLPARTKGARPWWEAWGCKAAPAARLERVTPDQLLPDTVRAQFPKLGARISRVWQSINDTTIYGGANGRPKGIIPVVEEGIRRGYTPLQIADGYPNEDYEGIAGQFEDAIGWRTDMIARTETAHAYNWGAWQAFSDAGVGKIQALDGTEFDAPCRERHEAIFDMGSDGEPIDNGLGTEDHPNGTLCWAPLVESIVTPPDEGEEG